MEIPNTMCIPNDIIFEILSRVPAKSLLRLRWTCKYWFDLITRDSDFIKLHLQYCSSTGTVSVIFHSRNFKSGQYYLNRNGLSTQVRISHPFEFGSGSGSGFVCLGSCNGLLLCRSDDHKKLCIWNPCTQEYKLLPDPPLIKSTVHLPPPEIYNKYSIYGFSYDRTLDDYQVIRNIDSLQVYALRTNSWRNIGINPIRKSYSSGKYVNGCLYWIVHNDKKLFCLDLGKKKYQEESIKQFLHGYAYRVDLEVLEGSLCLVQYIYEYEEFSVQIWVMKDNGTTANESSTRTSWTQLCTTPISLDRHYIGIELPIRFSGSDEILLLKDRKEFDLYDPKSDTTMILLNGIFRKKEDFFVLEAYIESLVSLNSGTYLKQD